MFLNNTDFQLKQGDKGLNLSLSNIQNGMTLILFYTNECPYCEDMIKIFKQLPTRINGCYFGMINLSKYKDIIEISQKTIAPIKYVPDLILYVNGAPFVRYDGEPQIESILNFLSEINQKIQHINFHSYDQPSESNDNQYVSSQQHSQQLFNQQQNPQMYNQQAQQVFSQHPQQVFNQQQQAQIKQENNNIPAYTIGIPLYGKRKEDSVCYLNFNSAYIQAN